MFNTSFGRTERLSTDDQKRRGGEINASGRLMIKQVLRTECLLNRSGIIVNNSRRNTKTERRGIKLKL